MRVQKGKQITAHDVRELQRFRFELELMVKLKEHGHTERCAKYQVFTCLACTCGARP